MTVGPCLETHVTWCTSVTLRHGQPGNRHPPSRRRISILCASVGSRPRARWSSTVPSGASSESARPRCRPHGAPPRPISGPRLQSRRGRSRHRGGDAPGRRARPRSRARTRPPPSSSVAALPASSHAHLDEGVGASALESLVVRIALAGMIVPPRHRPQRGLDLCVAILRQARPHRALFVVEPNAASPELARRVARRLPLTSETSLDACRGVHCSAAAANSASFAFVATFATEAATSSGTRPSQTAFDNAGNKGRRSEAWTRRRARESLTCSRATSQSGIDNVPSAAPHSAP